MPYATPDATTVTYATHLNVRRQTVILNEEAYYVESGIAQQGDMAGQRTIIAVDGETIEHLEPRLRKSLLKEIGN